jgi:N-acetylmuramoyl-L-alanine amidase
LNSEEGQDEIAKAIADAVISYKKEYYGNGEMEVFEERPVQKLMKTNNRNYNLIKQS